jgi:hypothetical protein
MLGKKAKVKEERVLIDSYVEKSSFEHKGKSEI